MEDRTLPSGGSPLVQSINRSLPLGPGTNATNVTYALTFNQSVTGVAATDFNVVTDGSVQAATPVAVSGTGAAYTVSISGIHGSGDLRLNLIDDDSIQGGGVPLGGPGLGNGSFQGQTYNILQTYPSVVSINRTTPADPATNASVVIYTVTFSKAVTGVDRTDFQLATTGTVGTTLTQVTPQSASVYIVTVSGIKGSGTLGLNLVDNGSIHDQAGNPLTQQNAPAAFQAQQTLATGPAPTSVAVGDVNGDGKPDLVVTTLGNDTVNVLLGNGNGSFQAQQTFASGYFPQSVALGDVNGDGKPDLVVANRSSNTVSVLLGNGNGTFQAQQTFATGSRPYSLALGDFNGDGKPDLAVANGSGNTVSVLLGNGNGTFQAQQTFATGSYPASVALGDVNGDGRLDLIVVNNQYSGTVSVLLGNGNGTFQAQQTFSIGSQPHSLALGDLNGDGKPDLVVANETNFTNVPSTVSVLLGNGNGTFQAQQTFGTGPQPHAVALGDLNGDGKLDLAVVNGSGNTVSVLLGNGNGTFQPQHPFATGSFPYSLALGDLNGDGKPDLAVVNRNNYAGVSLLLGNAGSFTGQVYIVNTVAPFVESINRSNPAGPTTNASSVSFTVVFSEPVIGVNPTDFQLATSGTVGHTLTQVTPGSSSVYTVTVSGITGDGVLGLNLVDNGSIRSLLGSPLIQQNAPASFQGQQTFATGPQPASVGLGDVNGDSKPDLAVANLSSNTVGVLLGNGNGTFQPQQTFPTGNQPDSVVAGDVNGDGNLDLLVANDGSNTVSVLFGNGNGTFQTQQTFATGIQPDSVAVGDMNGDGNLDLVVLNNGSDTVGVLLGNGNGTFQAQQTFATGSGPESAVVADLNGDGKIDIAIANDLSNTVSVLLGNGNGTFQAQQTIATGKGPGSVAAGDVNGDGRLDLVVANRLSSTVSVLLGNGNGTFQAQQTFATGNQPDSVAVGDVNGDGNPDLVVANSSSNSVGVLLGNGNGTFQNQITFATASSPRSLLVTDVTGDGKPDLAVANYGSNSVSVLVATTVNFTGQAYTMDNVAPFVQSISRANPNPTNAGTVHFTITFSEPVTGVDPTDFQLTLTGGVTTTTPVVVAVSGANYTVTVSGIKGNGTLGLNLLDDGSIRDLAGNPLEQPNALPSFQSQTLFPTGAVFYSMVLTDVNGDGKPDLVIANRGVSVLLGNGNGTFQSPTTYDPLAPFFSNFVSVADVNGDGKPDIVVGSYQGRSVSVLLGNGDGTFQNQLTFAKLGQTGTLAVADVNGDGKPDIAITAPLLGRYNSGFVNLLLGNGDGTFQTLTTVAASVGRALTQYRLDFADLNGDGKPDMVVSGNVLLGNGNGTFQNLISFGNGGQPPVAVLDVNGDGKPDLIVGAAGVLLGNGNGTFQRQTNFGNGSAVLAVGDVNGDGKPDLIVANNYNSSILSVLLANGNGTFQGQTNLVTGLQPFTSVTVADVNGDGRPDLVIAYKYNNDGTVLLNTANGNFTGQIYTVGNAGTATHIAITVPNSTPAGTPFVIGVVAEDQFNNTAAGYTGTVSFSSTDTQAVMSSMTATLSGGVGFFAATFETAGNQTLIATDSALASITGASSPITVSAAGAARFSVTNGLLSFPGVLSGPQNFAVTGMPLGITVTALDAFGNVAPTYAGVVHFASSDGAAALPADTTLTSGMGIFSATLAMAGTQSLTATDTVQNSGFNAITGTTGAIVARGLVVTSFALTPSGFTMAFDKPFDPTTVNLFTNAGLPDDVLLATTNTQVSLRGSLVFTPPTNVGGSPSGFTFVKTASVTATGIFNPSSGLLAAGKYTLTLRSFSAGSSGFQDAIGGALDGTNSGTPGNNFQITFSVSAPPVAVGIPGFARGPSNTDALFLPSTLTNGSTFAMSYTNPAANPTTGTATITFSTTAATLQSNIQAALSSGGLAKQVGTNAAAQNTPNSVVVITNDNVAGANVLVTFQSARARRRPTNCSVPAPQGSRLAWPTSMWPTISLAAAYQSL